MGTPQSAFGQRLAGLRAKQGSSLAQRTQETLTELKEGFKNADMFMDAVSTLDATCIQNLQDSINYSFSKATYEWYLGKWKGAGWDQQLELFRSIARGVQVSEDALVIIDEFSNIPSLLGNLREMVDEIIRPSRTILSREQLNNFLGNIETQGLILKVDGCAWGNKKFQWPLDSGQWYMPTNLAKAYLIWPFVTSAVGTVRGYEKTQAEVMPKIKPLLEQATLSSDPDQQFLNQLVRGMKIGSLVIYDTKFRAKEDGQEKGVGLLALLLNKEKKSGNFRLEGWVADKPLALPRETYELPPLLFQEQWDGSLNVGFHLETYLENKDEFDSLMQIQHLIRRRLSLEGRWKMLALPRPVQPKPEDVPQSDAKPEVAPKARRTRRAAKQ